MHTTNTCGLHLLHPCHSSTAHLLILLHRHRRREQPPWKWPPLSTTTTILACRKHHHCLLEPLQICKSRRWDSNAESFRTQNFNYDFDENDGDEEDAENDDSLEQWVEAFEDYIDSIWIFKVFRSFGGMLPFILASLLLASGLKAFLMALAVPIGQSTFSFAIRRMWGEKASMRKRKTKTKSRSRARFSRTVKWWDDKRAGDRGKKKANMGYQSWVPGNDNSTDPSQLDAPTFGGWDELDYGSKFDIGSSSNSGQTVERSGESSSEKGRLSMRTRKSSTPLLLRLLIAVFPFLSSWTKML